MLSYLSCFSIRFPEFYKVESAAHMEYMEGWWEKTNKSNFCKFKIYVQDDKYIIMMDPEHNELWGWFEIILNKDSHLDHDLHLVRYSEINH